MHAGGCVPRHLARRTLCLRLGLSEAWVKERVLLGCAPRPCCADAHPSSSSRHFPFLSSPKACGMLGRLQLFLNSLFHLQGSRAWGTRPLVIQLIIFPK